MNYKKQRDEYKTRLHSLVKEIDDLASWAIENNSLELRYKLRNILESDVVRHVQEAVPIELVRKLFTYAT
jgi:signal transduction histidine kinase